MTDQKTISYSLSLTVPQLEIISKGLVELPYREVVELIGDINTQIKFQNDIKNQEAEVGKAASKDVTSGE